MGEAVSIAARRLRQQRIGKELSPPSDSTKSSGSMLTSGDVIDLDLGMPAGREAGFRHPVVVVTAPCCLLASWRRRIAPAPSAVCGTRPATHRISRANFNFPYAVRMTI